MSNEKSYSPMSGYVMLTVVLLLTGLGLFGMIALRNPLFAWLFALAGILSPGFFFLNPNTSVVLVLFGDYKGTVKTSGFFWVNPFFLKKRISLRARNFDSE
ncbi:MAG: SPFH domain-containing protein, partial [Cyclobacteriaceae bacterium]|nr:SPFH domain-containing protein [Cyclobacteriaceae bacterium]